MTSALIPPVIRAGVTTELSVVSAAYPAPDWTVTLHLRGSISHDVEAVADGTAHRLEFAAQTTSNWRAGPYSYSLRAVRGTETVELEGGQLTVEVDLAQVGVGHDPRTHAKRVLEAIEATIEGRAGIDQESLKINNRELRRTPIADLLKLRARYRAEVQQENRRRRGQSILGPRVLTRFP